MNSKNEYPGWFLWLWENSFLVAVAMILALFVFGTLAVWYLESRLGELEGYLADTPPPNYEAPDLDGRAVELVPDGVEPERTFYVPIYSHVYFQGGRPFLLEAMLSIRNTDSDDPLYLTRVDYYDTTGTLQTRHLEQSIALKPLETLEFLVPQHDSRGGSGANFLVGYQARAGVQRPIVEAVMVGQIGSHAIAFARSGVQLNEESRPARASTSSGDDDAM